MSSSQNNEQDFLTDALIQALGIYVEKGVPSYPLTGDEHLTLAKAGVPSSGRHYEAGKKLRLPQNTLERPTDVPVSSSASGELTDQSTLVANPPPVQGNSGGIGDVAGATAGVVMGQGASTSTPLPFQPPEVDATLLASTSNVGHGRAHSGGTPAPVTTASSTLATLPTTGNGPQHSRRWSFDESPHVEASGFAFPLRSTPSALIPPAPPVPSTVTPLAPAVPSSAVTPPAPPVPSTVTPPAPPVPSSAVTPPAPPVPSAPIPPAPPVPSSHTPRASRIQATPTLTSTGTFDQEDLLSWSALIDEPPPIADPSSGGQNDFGNFLFQPLGLGPAASQPAGLALDASDGQAGASALGKLLATSGPGVVAQGMGSSGLSAAVTVSEEQESSPNAVIVLTGDSGPARMQEIPITPSEVPTSQEEEFLEQSFLTNSLIRALEVYAETFRSDVVLAHWQARALAFARIPVKGRFVNAAGKLAGIPEIQPRTGITTGNSTKPSPATQALAQLAVAAASTPTVAQPSVQPMILASTPTVAQPTVPVEVPAPAPMQPSVQPIAPAASMHTIARPSMRPAALSVGRTTPLTPRSQGSPGGALTRPRLGGNPFSFPGMANLPQRAVHTPHSRHTSRHGSLSGLSHSGLPLGLSPPGSPTQFWATHGQGPLRTGQNSREPSRRGSLASREASHAESVHSVAVPRVESTLGIPDYAMGVIKAAEVYLDVAYDSLPLSAEQARVLAKGKLPASGRYYESLKKLGWFPVDRNAAVSTGNNDEDDDEGQRHDDDERDSQDGGTSSQGAERRHSPRSKGDSDVDSDDGNTGNGPQDAEDGRENADDGPEDAEDGREDAEGDQENAEDDQENADDGLEEDLEIVNETLQDFGESFGAQLGAVCEFAESLRPYLNLPAEDAEEGPPDPEQLLKFASNIEGMWEHLATYLLGEVRKRGGTAPSTQLENLLQQSWRYMREYHRMATDVQKLRTEKYYLKAREGEYRIMSEKLQETVNSALGLIANNGNAVRDYYGDNSEKLRLRMHCDIFRAKNDMYSDMFDSAVQDARHYRRKLQKMKGVMLERDLYIFCILQTVPEDKLHRLKQQYSGTQQALTPDEQWAENERIRELEEGMKSLRQHLALCIGILQREVSPNDIPAKGVGYARILPDALRALEDGYNQEVQNNQRLRESFAQREAQLEQEKEEYASALGQANDMVENLRARLEQDPDGDAHGLSHSIEALQLELDSLEQKYGRAQKALREARARHHNEIQQLSERINLLEQAVGTAEERAQVAETGRQEAEDKLNRGMQSYLGGATPDHTRHIQEMQAELNRLQERNGQLERMLVSMVPLPVQGPVTRSVASRGRSLRSDDHEADDGVVRPQIDSLPDKGDEELRPVQAAELRTFLNGTDAGKLTESWRLHVLGSVPINGRHYENVIAGQSGSSRKSNSSFARSSAQAIVQNIWSEDSPKTGSGPALLAWKLAHAGRLSRARLAVYLGSVGIRILSYSKFYTELNWQVRKNVTMDREVMQLLRLE